MKTTVQLYRNKRNSNKYIEVHNDGYRHNSVKQFLFWKTSMVRYDTGDRILHRWRKESLSDLLTDYYPVNSVWSK